MDDRPATERLAEALTVLRTKAGNPSLATIENWGKVQRPPVSLSKGKLSGWFNGKSVPDAGKSFDTLIALLEARAHEKSGLPKRGIGVWRLLRSEAVTDRRNGEGWVTASNEALISAPPSSAASPDPRDAAKAGRLLRLLPHDGKWHRWLHRAPVLFKVPLDVRDPVSDALPELEVDRIRYIDPVLHDAHETLMERLAAFCDELDGMTDMSAEGQQVLEMSHPGTAAERNDLNRQACQARDEFLHAYEELLNLLNIRGLVPPTPENALDAPATPIIAVDLHAACTVSGGGIMTVPVALAGREQSRDFTEPYYFAVTAANQTTEEAQIASLRIEIDCGEGAMVPYLVSSGGPYGRVQLPFQLRSHARGHALANAAELGHAFRLIAERGGVPRRVRPVAQTGSGIDFPGSWIPVEELMPFLRKVFAGGPSTPKGDAL
ncbi:hypothetical protein [Streptomyces sp. NPDC059593]|uniref:hypothetical protein n=1 Tax=Streptomyces sp. NPDC059593 TaxID=3346878 RepID=UPI003697BCDD